MIAAVWVLLGAHLWGSESTQLTNLVMPAMVVALKVRADKAVTKVRKAAPKLVGSSNFATSHGQPSFEIGSP